MFTGIVESMVEVIDIQKQGTNKTFTFKCPFAKDFYIDQSISHNGVCLTVIQIWDDKYRVTAIQETLSKTNLDKLSIGDQINIERAARVDSRIDGHFVQGHVDKVVICTEVIENQGSWLFHFLLENEDDSLYLVNKGSVCINGVSLTVVEVSSVDFYVAIIPYTYENTNFKFLKKGDQANIEFDIFGKYVVQYLNKIYPTHKSS